MPFFIALNFIFFYHTKVGQGMKKLFVIYLCVLCLAPVLAHSATSCNTQACVDCVKVGGKSWDPLGNNGNGQCVGCPDDSYHPTCTGTTDCYEECTSVGPEHFRNNDGTGQIPCPTDNDSYPLSSSEAYHFIDQCGISTCNVGTSILIYTFDGTNHIYYCGNCGYATSEVMAGSSVLYRCDCEGILANHTYGTVINGGKRKECECPSNSDNVPFFLAAAGECRCGSAGQSSRPFAHINNGITTYECCPGLSTYDSNAGDCVCNVQFAKITRDANNNNKLTECACNDGTIHLGNSCGCQSSQYVTFDNNTNPAVNLGETPQYLSSCTTCPQNSTPESHNYPRFCKCNSSYYQEAPSSTSNPTPTCHQCPTQTQTPLPGSVGPESCRLKEGTNFAISNTHTRSMKLIPQGATILPIYTDPYVQNNNNAQSQYTH